MRSRHAVLLTPSKSLGLSQLLSRQQHASASPLAATLTGLPASVANKRLTVGLSPLDAAFTKNTGRGSDYGHPSVKNKPLSSLPRSVTQHLCASSSIFRTLFQVPYPASPLFAILAKTPGVWGYSSHFGTRALHSTRLSEGAFSSSRFEASSTGAVTISRTRSRSAGTSSLVSPLVSMVSCRCTVTFAGHSIQWPVR
jgi:hypothetical protein